MLRHATRSERERDAARTGVMTATTSATPMIHASKSNCVNACEVFLECGRFVLRILRPLNYPKPACPSPANSRAPIAEWSHFSTANATRFNA